jgi:hypothetical protein
MVKRAVNASPVLRSAVRSGARTQDSGSPGRDAKLRFGCR